MRVIAGRLRGRPLQAPPGDATRPTGARVKEALFAILGDMQDARVLDLYSGSGALGIEAMSRGAAHAVFVEAARPALACLRHNLSKLGLEAKTDVLAVRVEAAFDRLRARGPFDLVLCDPPWKDASSALEALETLAHGGILAPGARVVLEHSAKAPVGRSTEAGAHGWLSAYDRRHWGDTGVTFFSQAAQPADVPGEHEA